MTIITNGRKVYAVQYERKGPDTGGQWEHDAKLVQADDIIQAENILVGQLAAYHERDSRWQYRIAQGSMAG